jgi:pimeloyl-ACP methyl ester carboxylesterase
MKKLFLCVALLGVAFSAGFPAERRLKPLSWKTSDGVEMQGLIHLPKGNQRLWILLHGLGSVKEEWLKFADPLIQRGEGFLIYDARGHGQSVRLASGGRMDYHQFQVDLASAVETTHSRYGIPEQRIAVGGASLGANVALVYASRHREVPALILLSPGLDYAGIESEKAFIHYGSRPVFMAASPEDRYAFETVRHLTGLRRDAGCRVAEGPGAAHGVNMLKSVLSDCRMSGNPLFLTP